MTPQQKTAFEAILKDIKPSNYNSVTYYLKQLMTAAYNMALTDASEAADIKHHCGTSKKDTAITYFQSGVDNLTISKQSILDLKIK